MKSLLAVLALSLGAQAAPDGPMAAFQPYVGDWTCLEHTDGRPDRVSQFRFVLDPTLLRETIEAPPGPDAPHGDVTNATFAFDAKTRRYVEIEMGGDAVWYVSTAPAASNGVLHWTDIAAATPLSRWDMTLPKGDAFTVDSFARPTDKAPNYHATCRRKAA